MLNGLIRWSLRYRTLVLWFSLALLVGGAGLATLMPIDVFPDLDRPRVVILAECPGLAATEVETLVTQPMETAVLGASGVEAVRSQSTAGLAVIYIEFSWQTEVRAARQTIQERLSSLALPEGIRPQMTPPASIMGQIVIAGLYRQRGPHNGELIAVPDSSYVLELPGPDDGQPGLPALGSSTGSDTDAAGLRAYRVVDRRRQESWQPVAMNRKGNQIELDGGKATFEWTPAGVGEARGNPMELRALADWVIRPRLLRVPGLAEVLVQGGEQKQFQVLVNPQLLASYGVSLQDVEQALAASNQNTSGGFSLSGDTERPIRILGRVGPGTGLILAELSKVPVKQSEVRPVLLEDVARITTAPAPKRGEGSINGQPGVVFTIVKQPHADTRQLTRQVVSTLEEIEQTLPPDMVLHSGLFRLENFIDRSIANVGEALAIGATLVIGVLFLFLLSFRTTLITLTAIPLSLVVTVLVFRLLGEWTGTRLTINVMTLGGIAVAMGELVDDAIVDVENIFRRLRINASLACPRPRLEVVFEASSEIRSAIVFGTAVVVLVFLPLFALSGVEGRLFAPLGLAYIVSILASLLVSLTVTPVLGYFLLDGSAGRSAHRDSAVLRFLKSLASPLIRGSMASPGLWLAISWACLGWAGWEASRLGRNFLPQFDEGSMQVNVTLPPGSSLEASNRTAALIDSKFRNRQQGPGNPHGEIVSFVRRTGRAEMDEHAAPVQASEYLLSMNPAVRHNRSAILHGILDELREEVPGADIEVEQPLAHLISHMVSGVYSQIAIKVVGDDLEVLLATAEQIRDQLQDLPGLTPPVLEPVQFAPELQIRLLPGELARHGLTSGYVGQILQTALQGAVVSQVLEGPRRFDLVVRMEPAFRGNHASLENLLIDLPGGESQVELGALARIEEVAGPIAVNRENARRRVVIRCNARERDLAGAVRDIRQRIGQSVVLPPGYHLEFGGQFESQQRAATTILVLAGVSIAGMFGLLLLLFPSVRIVLQILNALPTAFAGGVLALVLTGQTLTIAALVGFISLGGIAVRNGILLVSHYFHLMRVEREPFGPAMILRGSLERLAPVLMTAMTAGIGLAPLVWGGHEPGREILYPVATVILGGLITSTFCEFLIHPGLFLSFGGKDAEQIVQGAGDAADKELQDAVPGDSTPVPDGPERMYSRLF